MTTKADLPRISTNSTKVGDELATHGDNLWDMFSSWTYGPRPAPASGERGGGGSEVDQEDRKDEAAKDRRASRIFDQWKTALANKEEADNELRRLIAIGVLEDRTKTRNRAGELNPILAAEVAAAGLCVSCHRLDQTCFDREKDGKGVFYDREACRRCRRFKNDEGIYPPVELLHIWHKLGRRFWTTAEVAAALDNARNRSRIRKAS